MNVKIITTLVLSCLLAACGSEDESAPIILTNVDETELENDSFATAQEIEMNSEIAGSLTQLEIVDDSDLQDFYKVQVTSTKVLELRLEGVDINADRVSTEGEGFVADPLDVDLDLYRYTDENLPLNPDEDLMPDPVESSYSNGNSESLSIELESAETGIYYIKISTQFNQGTGTYSLSIYQ